MATKSMSIENDLPNGPVAAALLAGGIGSAVLGVITTASEVSTGFANVLNWMKPVGPLSGKVGVTVLIYLLSWLGLFFTWRGKNVDFNRIATIAFILLAIGLLGTFPPVFELIAGK